MKVLKQILFAAAVMICFSITASAQRQDDKKPKNPETPKIKVVPKEGEKPKDNEKPKGDKKKKPQSAYLRSTNKDDIIFI